jgi:pimeloyl-ACP methyl ester carboxylesterase
VGELSFVARYKGAMSATVQSTFVHKACSFAVKRRGEGAPVLFIQGTGLHGDGWLPQIDALASSFDCIWFDNRGMSGSQPIGEVKLTVEQMAEDARAVLDHLEVERAHVVGHSLGGCIALQLALDVPERVRSLALLCTSSSGPGLVKMSPAMMWRGVRTMIGTRRSRRRAFLEMVLTPEAHATADLDALAEELAPVFGHDLAEQPPVVMKQVRAMSRWDVTDRLGELEGLPTLVLGAGHDVIARPPLVDLLAEGMAHARVERWPAAAHGVTVTQADHINVLLSGFFDTI